MIRPGIRRLFRLPIWRRDLADQDLDEEIRLHLDLRAEQLEAEGMSPEAARAEARRRFHAADPAHRELRRAARRRDDHLRAEEWIFDLLRDVRYAVRTLSRSPGYSVVIVLTLALGIGTSVAIHAVVRGLVTDAVPFQDPDRLVSVDVTRDGQPGGSPREEDFRIWESEAERAVVLGGFTFGSRTLGDGARTFYARGTRVTDGFFPALSVRPYLGRTLVPDDFRSEGGPVVVLGYRVWAGPLGADPGIVGQPVLLDGSSHTVVGVLPEGHEFPTGTDLWTPLLSGDDLQSVGYLSAIGRLRPDVGEEEARVALETLQRGLDAERPEDERASQVNILPLTGRWAESALQALLLLQIAVVSLLLIGTAAASGLMLTRGLERQHEIAIRASLGASRWRIIRQLFLEAGLLAFAGGVLGLLVAHLTIAVLRLGPAEEFARNNLPGWELLGVDGRAVAVALILSAGTAIVVALVPALRAVRGDLTAGIRDDALTATGGRGRSRLLRILLSAEVALALVLLMTAGLLTRSLFELMRLDPGYRTESILAVRWGLPADRYESGDAVARFHEPFLERLGGIPGIRSAGMVSNLPNTRFGRGATRSYRLHGADPGSEPFPTGWRSISPGYFETLGITLLSGRPFGTTDSEGAPRVAIISRALAQRHWPESVSPLGAVLEVDEEAWTVVGVASDVRDGERALGPVIYVPQRQAPTTSGFAVIRVGGDPARLAAEIRQEIWSMNPAIAVEEVRTMDQILRDTYANDRTLALLVGVFATTAVLITVVSLYSLVSHSVASRRRELGIRIALGASRRRIVAGAMLQGMVCVGVGAVVGIALGSAMAQLIRSMLYGLSPTDTAVLIVIPAGLLLLTALASYVPARRAARMDPVISLRTQ